MLPDSAFVDQIRDLLVHLHDSSYLQNHPLMTQFGLGDQVSSSRRLYLLRSLLTKAIEEMSPGAEFAFRSPQTRTYDVLNLRYMEGLMIQEVARELALSERQAYRDLRKAERDLAALLWTRRQVVPSPSEEMVLREAVLAEAGRVTGPPEKVELIPLLQSSIEAVAPLAQKRRVRIVTVPPNMIPSGISLVARTSRTLLRQILVSVLSHAIQHGRPEKDVTLAVQRERDGVRFGISYLSAAEELGEWRVSLATPQQLVQLQGGEWEMGSGPHGRRQISFILGREYQATVLVIDDNEELIELFRRYLASESYRLIEARDGKWGVSLAEQYRPDVIVLDMMMPEQDGWETLQVLRHGARTRDVPVIVCSVIYDPELTYSLGATEILKKPVNPEELLRAVEMALLKRNQPSANPGALAGNQ